MDNQNIILLFLSFICPIIFGAVVFYLIRQIKTKTNQEINIPAFISEEGYNIPVATISSGGKGIPIIGFAHNNFNPSLVLFNDYLEIKMFSKKAINYGEIEMVDMYDLFISESVIFTFKNSDTTFTANLINKKNLVKLLQYFKQKGINFSEKANGLIQNI